MQDSNQGFLKTYKVILILFAYLLIMSLLFSLSTLDSLPVYQEFMYTLMGLFFIIFSFFKVIHLPEFHESFALYDPIARYIPFYGYLYPFLELILGSLFIGGIYIPLISIITIVVLTSTTIGVISTLRKGEILECACLGVVFDLPLSKVTVFENTVMILMAIMAVIGFNYLL